MLIQTKTWCGGGRRPHHMKYSHRPRIDLVGEGDPTTWTIHTDQELISRGKATPRHEIFTQTKNWCGGGTWPHHMICSYWPRVDLAGEGDPTTWNINTYQDLMWWGNVTPPHDKPIKMRSDMDNSTILDIFINLCKKLRFSIQDSYLWWIYSKLNWIEIQNIKRQLLMSPSCRETLDGYHLCIFLIQPRAKALYI